jgi:hypothetical protein
MSYTRDIITARIIEISTGNCLQQNIDTLLRVKKFNVLVFRELQLGIFDEVFL